jgi:O-acetyl-ADP-ribose deacetylase (regulator of RNase III)
MGNESFDNLLEFDGKKIYCVKGITYSKAQAIVNSANNHLWMAEEYAGCD